MFQNCNTLLISLNVRISRGLEQFHRVDLAESAQVTKIRKDDWSRADKRYGTVGTSLTHSRVPRFYLDGPWV
jgi:hypothetical protein